MGRLSHAHRHLVIKDDEVALTPAEQLYNYFVTQEAWDGVYSTLHPETLIKTQDTSTQAAVGEDVQQWNSLTGSFTINYSGGGLSAPGRTADGVYFDGAEALQIGGVGDGLVFSFICVFTFDNQGADVIQALYEYGDGFADHGFQLRTDTGPVLQAEKEGSSLVTSEYSGSFMDGVQRVYGHSAPDTGTQYLVINGTSQDPQTVTSNTRTLSTYRLGGLLAVPTAPAIGTFKFAAFKKSAVTLAKMQEATTLLSTLFPA